MDDGGDDNDDNDDNNRVRLMMDNTRRMRHEAYAVFGYFPSPG
jgi:hypothetical protein